MRSDHEVATLLESLVDEHPGVERVAADRNRSEWVAVPAIGARVGSFLWGSAWSGLILALRWGSPVWWMCVPVYGIALAAFMRSLFLGVSMSAGLVVVSSWFRTYRFVEGEVSAVDKQRYFGWGGAGVGWLPIAGSVRMIELRLAGGRLVALPSTLGRRNAVLRLARQMRESLGLHPR